MAKENKNQLHEELELILGINARLQDHSIIIEKGNEKIERKFNPCIEISIEDKKIILKTRKAGRVEKRLLGSIVANIKNAINGFKEPFKYKLQIANVHFPMTVTYDKNTNEILVKNFLGEKKDRRIKVRDNVTVKINKEIIELESADIDNAGQTAANIEKGTKIRFRDRRIFQDGIFITEKPGRVFS